MLGSTLPAGPIANPDGTITTLIAAGKAAGLSPVITASATPIPARGLFPRQRSRAVSSRNQLPSVPVASPMVTVGGPPGACRLQVPPAWAASLAVVTWW